jgi:hypothetical protein
MKTCCPVIFVIGVLLAGCGQGEQPVKPDSNGSASVQPEPAAYDAALAPPEGGKKKPDDLIGGLFELGTSLAKTADEIGQEILGLSAKAQKEIGERLHKKLNPSTACRRTARNWPASNGWQLLFKNT